MIPINKVEASTLPEHYDRIASALSELTQAVQALLASDSVRLCGRADFQIRRLMAGHDRLEGEGLADPDQVQSLHDHDMSNNISFHWNVTPSSKQVRRLVIKPGYCERFDPSFMELIFNFDEG